MICFCSRSRIARAESREIPTIFATFVAGRLSAKNIMAVSFLAAGKRAPLNRRSRMDLEATVVNAGGHPPCCASDFADQVAPGEFVYDSLPNAKQAAVGVMALWLGITSLFVI